jgi:serine kinase of HPr protein (carbohydrate metabolism regulator)
MSEHEIIQETIHATSIAIEHDGLWRAVLLAGPSGAGKSDLGLRLIDRGARLISDDYTDLRSDGDRLIATPPARIAGRIEVRGLGIVALRHLEAVPVALLVALDEPVPRMPDEPLPMRRLAGIDVPLIAAAAFEASTPLKIEIVLARLAVA